MNDSMQPVLVGASLLIAAAAACLAWILVGVAWRPRVVDPEQGRFEEQRRREIRQVSWTYRTFEPWVDEIAGPLAARQAPREGQVQRDLVTAAVAAPWRAAEYVATLRVSSLLAGGAVALLVGLIFGPVPGLLSGAAVVAFYPGIAVQQLAKRAERRRQQLKRQVASATDLLALMMEVGGGFQECLAKVAAEAGPTPLGYELSRVLDEIESGRPRKEALRSLADRIGDGDISDLVLSVVQGEELGTPLATILRNQADQIRQKRSLWAEKACQEAQVNLVFPAMVIMVACLVLVTAPFILSAVFSPGGI